MKKFITTLILAFVAVFNANAQWLPDQFEEADELKGTKETTISTYIAPTDPKCVVMYNTDDVLMLALTEGIYDYNYLVGEKTVEITIGYYIREDGKDKLVDKSKVIMLLTDYKTCGIKGKEVKKIANHLKNKGNVRFIIPLRRSHNLDFVVPKKKEPTIGVEM